MTNGDYLKMLANLSSLSAAVRLMDLEAFVEAIEESETMKALHKPTEQQLKNVADIKRTAKAALELKKVIIEIAGESKVVKPARIVLPGTMQ